MVLSKLLGEAAAHSVWPPGGSSNPVCDPVPVKTGRDGFPLVSVLVTGKWAALDSNQPILKILTTTDV